MLFWYSLKSYSTTSFIWLYDLFYKDNIKIIPKNLDKYLTPLTLATLLLSSVEGSEGWSFEGRSLFKNRLILDRSLVTIKDYEYLSLVLKNKYHIKTVFKFNPSGLKGGSLCIPNSSEFSSVVKPYMLSSQLHLLNRPNLKLNLFGKCISRRVYVFTP